MFTSRSIDQENVMWIHKSGVFSHEEEQNYVICRETDVARNQHAEQCDKTQKDSTEHFLSYTEPRVKYIHIV